MRLVALIIIAIFAINYSYIIDNEIHFLSNKDKSKLEILQSNYKKLQCEKQLTNYNMDSCTLLKHKLDLEVLAYTLEKNKKDLVIAYDRLQSLQDQYDQLVKEDYEREYRLAQSKPRYHKKRVYAAK